jgi:hypothetical protein
VTGGLLAAAAGRAEVVGKTQEESAEVGHSALEMGTSQVLAVGRWVEEGGSHL